MNLVAGRHQIDRFRKVQIDEFFGGEPPNGSIYWSGVDQIDESGGWEVPNRSIYWSGGTRLMNLMGGRNQVDLFTGREGPD